MPDNKKIDLSIYRLEKAKETCQTAFENTTNLKYSDANNRAYYSIFHSIRAVLALDGVDFNKHSAVISYFREKYIKTGLFDKKYSDIIGKANIVRSKSDYEDFYISTKNEAVEQANNAKIFLNAVTEYIDKYLQNIKCQ